MVSRRAENFYRTTVVTNYKLFQATEVRISHLSFVTCPLSHVLTSKNPKIEKAPTVSRLFQIDAIYCSYANFTFMAFNPFRPSSSSNSTSSFSLILSIRPETWTKYSFFDSSSIMKPNPFVSLKNLTVPLLFIILLN